MDIKPSGDHTIPPQGLPDNTGADNQQPRVTATQALPQIPRPDPNDNNVPADTSLQQRSVAATNPAGAGNLPDGQILIEAGDDPEAAADQAVQQIEKEHGSEKAKLAKSFFRAAIGFCKKHKGSMLSVVGFGMLTGAMVGGVVFPGFFLLAAPGMLLFASGTIGSELPPPNTSALPPPPNTPAAPSTDPVKNKKPEDKDEDEDKNKAKPPAANNTPASAPGGLPEPNKPLQPDKPGYEDDLRARIKQLEDELDKSKLKAQVTPVSFPTSAKPFNVAKNLLSSKHPVNSNLTENDRVVFDREEAIKNLTGLNEKEITSVSVKSSKVNVALDFFKADEENNPHSILKDIVPQELSILKNTYQRAVFEQAVKAVKEEKAGGDPLSAEQIATNAAETQEVKDLIAKLTPPATKQQDADAVHNQFVENVEQFLNDFSHSLNPAFVQQVQEEKIKR